MHQAGMSCLIYLIYPKCVVFRTKEEGGACFLGSDYYDTPPPPTTAVAATHNLRLRKPIGKKSEKKTQWIVETPLLPTCVNAK